ncbi:MAG: hypothetical protein HY436_01820 [Candidatus Liptonbacteria bacterium]|nr:hypothetical protein [Candidatus Liptonbacteria bacterium]
MEALCVDTEETSAAGREFIVLLSRDGINRIFSRCWRGEEAPAHAAARIVHHVRVQGKASRDEKDALKQGLTHELTVILEPYHGVGVRSGVSADQKKGMIDDAMSELLEHLGMS